MLTMKQRRLALSNSDIKEIQYIGKSVKYNDRNNTNQTFERLLVRRKYVLEIIETNGLTFKFHKIEDSKAKEGFYLSDMIISYNCKQFIIYYENEENYQKIYMVVYQYDKDLKKYL